MTITTHLREIARTKRLLTTRETAALLGVTPDWIRDLITSGELRAINVGGAEKAARWRVDPEDVLAMMQSRQSRPRDLIAG